MKNMLLLCCLFSAFTLSAQTGQLPINLGHTDSIYSNVLKENRPLWIYSPPLDTPFYAAAQYPVLYVLDGDMHFPVLVTILQELANGTLPKMIIVGIPNTGNNRARDLTPTTDPTAPGSGGGRQFTAFFEKELIPYISKKYPAASHRTLIGHSLGGLLSTDILLNNAALFSAYISIDPSLFFNSKAIIKQYNLPNTAGKKFFLAIAHTMNAKLDTASVRKDNALPSIHTTTMLELQDILKSQAPQSFNWKAKYYEDENHGSLPVIAMYDGLKFIFKNFGFPTYLYNDASCPADSLKQLITDHYKLLSKDLGYPVKPIEAQFNDLGYRYLQQQHYELAKVFLELNTHYFPERSNPYDGLGDYYVAIKDKARAIESFKKALSIQFDNKTNDKLKKLQAN